MTELQTSQIVERREGLGDPETERLDRSLVELRQQAHLTPRPLTSNTPVIGKAIAWFRNMWNSVSTRWYIAPLAQQQTRYNQLVVDELQTLAMRQQELRRLFDLVMTQQELRQLLDEISERLVATDRDVVALTHDLGKVTYAVIRLDEDIKRIDSTPT